MIKWERQHTSTDEHIDFDLITVESDDKTLYVGVSLDTLLKSVTVTYNEIEDKEAYTPAELNDFQLAHVKAFETVKQARQYFDDTRKVSKVMQLIKQHKRKGK